MTVIMLYEFYGRHMAACWDNVVIVVVGLSGAMYMSNFLMA